MNKWFPSPPLPVCKFTAKLFGTGHLGHLLPPWAQASFSFPIPLAQSIPSVTVRSHIRPNSKRKIWPWCLHSFTSCSTGPTPWCPSKAPLFQGVEAFLLSLYRFTKPQIVFRHSGLIVNFIALVFSQGHCILSKFWLGYEWLCLPL